MQSYKTEHSHNFYKYECGFCGGTADLQVPVAFTQAGRFRCPFVGCKGQYIQMPRQYGRPAHLLWTSVDVRMVQASQQPGTDEVAG